MKNKGTAISTFTCRSAKGINYTVLVIAEIDIQVSPSYTYSLAMWKQLPSGSGDKDCCEDSATGRAGVKQKCWEKEGHHPTSQIRCAPWSVIIAFLQ